MNQYSVKKVGSKAHYQFSAQPPKAVRDALKTNAKWRAYQKDWVCDTAAGAKAINQALKTAKWKQCDAVTPVRTPLSVTIKESGDNVVMRFNRSPDDAIKDALKKFAATANADDRREWLVHSSQRNAVRALLHQYEVGTGKDKAAEAPEAPLVKYDVQMRVRPDKVILHFETGVPPPEHLSQVQQKLEEAGINVTTIKSK